MLKILFYQAKAAKIRRLYFSQSEDIFKMLTEQDIKDCRLETIRDVIRYAMTRFEEEGIFLGHGCADCYEEAYFLVLRALKLDFSDLERFWDARLTAKELKRILEMIERRAVDKVPTPYLLNEAWLTDHVFYCDERVLIPRSYIAELLQDAFDPWVDDPEGVTSVLDLCTGSGCLGILAAETFPNAKVDCADISPDALDVAEINLANYGLTDEIELVETDLFNNLQGRKYDIIISNPPYVTEEAMENLTDEYKHEPELALGAGVDGLDIVRRMLAEAKDHLNDGGLLIVEVGDGREACEEAFPELPFIWLSTENEEDMVFLLRKEDL